jgi:hypothetical protein
LGQINLLPWKSSPHTTMRAEMSARPCQRGSGGRARATKQRGQNLRGGAEERSRPTCTLRWRQRRRGRRRRGEVADTMAGGTRSSLRMPRWRRRGQAPWQGSVKGRSRQALCHCLPWIWLRGAGQRKPQEGEEPRYRCSISLPREGGEGAAPPMLAATLGAATLVGGGHWRERSRVRTDGGQVVGPTRMECGERI